MAAISLKDRPKMTVLSEKNERSMVEMNVSSPPKSSQFDQKELFQTTTPK